MDGERIDIVITPYELGQSADQWSRIRRIMRMGHKIPNLVSSAIVGGGLEQMEKKLLDLVLVT